MVVIKPSDWETESVDLVSGQQIPTWIETELRRYQEKGWLD
jgi:hypothetical protein